MSSEQYLVQSLMWKKCVTEDHLRSMATKCINVDPNRPNVTESELTSEMLSQLIAKVNRNVRPFNLQVSRGPNESDGTVYYALINTADDDITQMAKHWKPEELVFFRKLVAKIIESNDCVISSTRALNTGRDEDIKLTMTAAEHLINKFVEQKWLEETDDGSIAIGVRTLLELNVYLKNYFEVMDCFRCKTLCIRGSNCMSCGIKLHFHCIDSQFIPNNKCPNCSKKWSSNSQHSSANSCSNSGEIFVSNNTHSEDENSETEEEEKEKDEEEDEEEEEVIRRPKRSKRH